MRLPIFFIGAEFCVFHSVEEAESALEPIDARSGRYQPIDSSGLRLQFNIVPKRVRIFFGLFRVVADHVEIGPGEASPSGREPLKKAMSIYLEDLGKQPEWIRQRSFEELVREASAPRSH